MEEMKEEMEEEMKEEMEIVKVEEKKNTKSIL